jgi:hypothetical protein
MPLDGSTRRAPREQRALRATAKATVRPPSRAKLKREEEAASALEFREAQAARRKGEVAYDAALKRCVRSGVFPDFAANPEPVGTNRVVYVDGQTQIMLFVAESTVGLNHVGFIADLLKANVDPKLVKRLTKRHRTETRPAHRLTSSPVG